MCIKLLVDSHLLGIPHAQWYMVYYQSINTYTYKTIYVVSLVDVDKFFCLSMVPRPSMEQGYAKMALYICLVDQIACNFDAQISKIRL